MSDLQQQLEELRQEYLADLPKIAQRLREAASQAPSQEVLQQMRHEVHKLAGNAAAFEQMAIAHLASELDGHYSEWLNQNAPPSQDSKAAELQRLIEMLDNTAS